MRTHRSIALTPGMAAALAKPIRGRGGFQSLLRRLQRQGPTRRLRVTSADAERLARYAARYGRGGFQSRSAALHTRWP